MEGLKTRGVRGVEFVVSDDHAGLKRAVRELLPEAVWQRCYVHFLRNALDYLPRKADDDCRQELRWLYDRRNLKEAQQDLKAWLTRWATRDPKLTDWVEAHIGETLTFYSLPRQHHKHLKSTNMLKRLNEEDQAADAAEDGALVSPFTGLPVQGDDPFVVGGLGLAVRGGPVCMASWEDAAPWLAKMARASAEHLDALSQSHRHTRVLKDARRLASVQLGYNEPLFGVTAADDRYTLPTRFLPAGIDCGALSTPSRPCSSSSIRSTSRRSGPATARPKWVRFWGRSGTNSAAEPGRCSWDTPAKPRPRPMNRPRSTFSGQGPGVLAHGAVSWRGR